MSRDTLQPKERHTHKKYVWEYVIWIVKNWHSSKNEAEAEKDRGYISGVTLPSEYFQKSILSLKQALNKVLNWKGPRTFVNLGLLYIHLLVRFSKIWSQLLPQQYWLWWRLQNSLRTSILFCIRVTGIEGAEEHHISEYNIANQMICT